MLNHVPNPVSGTSLQAGWLARLWSAVRANRLLPGLGYKLKYSSLGTLIEIEPSRGGQAANPARRYLVKSVEADYVVCRTWDGTTEGSVDVKVAKPPHLRHSLTSQVINGVTVSYGTYAISGGICTRLATAGGYADQTEMVVPVFQLASGASPDDQCEIWADEPEGGTDVQVSGVELTWLDQNRDARAWCETQPE